MLTPLHLLSALAAPIAWTLPEDTPGWVSLAVAMAALILTWRTVKDGRAAQRDYRHDRELARLGRIADLVAAVWAASEDPHPVFGSAQLRLDAALVGEERLPRCRDLTEVDSDVAFEVAIEALDEVGTLIGSLESRYAPTVS